MNKSYWCILYTLFIFIACKPNKYYPLEELRYMDLKYSVGSDSLYIEFSPDTSREQQLVDNLIYTPRYNALFEVKWTRNSKELNYFLGTQIDSMKKTGDCHNQLKYLQISVPKLVPKNYITFREQSVMNQNFYSLCMDTFLRGQTGVVENGKNIRLHHFRNYNLLSTFHYGWPLITFPASVGKKWHWNYKLDSYFSRYCAIPWDGIMDFEYNYEIVGIEKLSTEVGIIECYKIKCITRYTNNEEVSCYYFNSKLGFVKFDYQFADNRRCIIEIVKYNEIEK